VGNQVPNQDFGFHHGLPTAKVKGNFQVIGTFREGGLTFPKGKGRNFEREFGLSRRGFNRIHFDYPALRLPKG